MPTRAAIRALVILLGFITALGLSQAQSAPLIGSQQQATQPVPTFGPVIGGPTPTIATTPTPNVTPTALPTLRKDLMGIQAYCNLQEDLWSGIVDRAQFMGFSWIKCQLSWKELEPDAKGSFSAQFDAIKKNIIYAGRRSFKILLSVAKAPDWARPENARGQRNGPPANPADLGDFLSRLFDHFGPDSAYINAFELWNEANTVDEWTGAPTDGATYMKYFSAGYKVIRAKAPSLMVITAGPTPGGATDDRQWLQQIYDAGLPKNDPNLAIGVHPYGWANPPDTRCCASPSKGWDNNKVFFFLDTVYDYRDIMVKNNDAQAKLWATEFGWATFQGLHYKDHVNGPAAIPPAEGELGWMNILTEQQQADYVVGAFKLAQSGDLAGFVGPMFLWNMNFATLPGYVNEDKPSLPEAGFSVLDMDWNTRPVYNLLQAAPKK